MITETTVQPVQVDYICDACKEGKMRATGMVLTSSPPIFPHRCDKCGNGQNFDTNYPHIAYR